MIEQIKNMAHNVAESFLTNNVPINTQIRELHSAGKIENNEVLKRICEIINQNVYLSLFHDGNIDNSNISFEYANYDSIVKDINSMENDMDEYNTPVEDFRDVLDIFSNLAVTKTASQEQEKIAEAHEAKSVLDQLTSFRNTLQNVRTDSIKTAELSFQEMKKEAKLLSYNGDSLDDMKILSNAYLVGEGYETEKTAAAYNLIGCELEEGGFKINQGFSKLASENINPEDEFFIPIEKFASAVEMIPATDEALAHVNSMISKLSGAIYG